MQMISIYVYTYMFYTKNYLDLSLTSTVLLGVSLGWIAFRDNFIVCYDEDHLTNALRVHAEFAQLGEIIPPSEAFVKCWLVPRVKIERAKTESLGCTDLHCRCTFFFLCSCLASPVVFVIGFCPVESCAKRSKGVLFLAAINGQFEDYRARGNTRL